MHNFLKTFPCTLLLLLLLLHVIQTYGFCTKVHSPRSHINIKRFNMIPDNRNVINNICEIIPFDNIYFYLDIRMG